VDITERKQSEEALSRANKDWEQTIKVVIASGYSANGPSKDALTAGARGFVSKPYDAWQVLAVVREVLDAE
jgi:DNA-binding NarL/FixJ family response regulator